MLDELKREMISQGYKVVDKVSSQGQVVLRKSEEGIISVETLNVEVDTLRAILLLLGYSSIMRSKDDNMAQLILKKKNA